jgi:hypothetical protein
MIEGDVKPISEKDDFCGGGVDEHQLLTGTYSLSWLSFCFKLRKKINAGKGKSWSNCVLGQN